MPSYGNIDHEYGLTLATTDPDDDGPVWMVNLMKYKDIADYGDGGATGRSGRDADNEYTPTGPLKAVGATIVYAAEVEMTPLGDGTQWDRIGIIRYPTRRAFIEMQERQDFKDKHVHKEAGMEQTFVIGCQPMPQQPDEREEWQSADWDDVEHPPTAEDGELHVLHVVKWADGGVDEMEGYHDEAAKVAGQSGVRIGGWFNVEGTIIGDGRSWDQVRFNVFPSMKEFMENVVANPGRLEAQANHREVAMADTYTMFCRPIINQLRESF
jgi:hypothetical protein